MSKKIQEGDKCPIFALKDQDGDLFNIKSVLGKQNLVIYFYPKDDSSSCTKQACSFRDAYEDFVSKGVKVIGISSDDEESHKQFAEKHDLPFTLLADTDKKVRKLFDVPTNLLGLIPGRVTYIINKKGIVVKIFNAQMKPEKHVKEAFTALEAME